MSQKSVWLTWMPQRDDALAPQQAVSALGRSGLAGSGAPWIHAPEEFAWVQLAERLLDGDGPDVWLIAGSGRDFADADNRFGLSMVASMVCADRRPPPHFALLGLDGAPDVADLPTMLRSCQLLDGSGAAWAAKLLVAATGDPRAPSEPFRLRAIAQKMLGQWFEVGPVDGRWKGAMFGVSGDAKITNHAVGPSGGLPERTVLEYKLEGIELEVGDDAFVAWAVQNELSAGDSYYVKVEGTPAKLLIGEHPDSAPEVAVLSF